MLKIHKIEASSPKLAPKKKVAAYCRVSETSENLLHSLSAQISYYNDLIQKNPEWDFAGIYADKAITGTSTVRREELNRMLADCEAGKINLILVKSISRFARNTIDTLEMVRHLKEIGVEVRFERENISSFSGDGELMLTILASFAEEESRSISQNVKWGIRKRFEKGEQNGFKAPYGYYWDGEMYRQIPEQATAVRLIFDMYLAGESPFQIRDELAKRGYLSQEGCQITDNTIRYMLSNPSYMGVQILQKNYIDDNHRRIRNQAVLPKYMVEGMFEPIVTKEEFDRAQKIKEERVKLGPLRDAERTRYSGRMICGNCGFKVCRRTANKRKKWVCNCKDRYGKGQCDLNAIYENELDEITDEVLDGREFRYEIDHITVFNDRLEFTHLNRRKTIRFRTYGKGKYDAFSGKMVCGCCGKKVSKMKDHWMKDGKRIWVTYCRCQDTKDKCNLPRLSEEDLLRACRETLGTEHDTQLMFARDVKRLVFFPDRLEFERRDGEVKTWQRK